MRTLKVVVICCGDLQNEFSDLHPRSGSGSYATLKNVTAERTLLKKSFKTFTVNTYRDPVWMQEFEMKVNPRTTQLVFQVFALHQDNPAEAPASPHLLGEVVLDLKYIVFTDNMCAERDYLLTSAVTTTTATADTTGGGAGGTGGGGADADAGGDEEASDKCDPTPRIRGHLRVQLEYDSREGTFVNDPQDNEIISNSVSSAIKTYCQLDKLPVSALLVAEFIENFNNLFDLLNSSNKKKHGEYQHSDWFFVNREPLQRDEQEEEEAEEQEMAEEQVVEVIEDIVEVAEAVEEQEVDYTSWDIIVQGDEYREHNISNTRLTESEIENAYSDASDDSADQNFIDVMRHRIIQENDLDLLPVGWTRNVLQSDLVYYSNAVDRLTTWEFPQDVDDIRMLNLGRLPDNWTQNTDAHGRISFRNNDSLQVQWIDPRLELRAASRTSVESIRTDANFNRKYTKFRNNLPVPPMNTQAMEIKVRRQFILEESFHAISIYTTMNMMKKPVITMDDDLAIDYGGVSREWFLILSKQMLDPQYGLFKSDHYMHAINVASETAYGDHMHYFQFFGRFMGMALYHGFLIEGYFVDTFYKLLLSVPVTVADMKYSDEDYYNSLVWILNNDPSGLGLTFSLEHCSFGQLIQVDLMPNGAQIPVDNNNKLEYIELVVKWKLVDSIKPQMLALVKGFHELIPEWLISAFKPHELKYMLSGLKDIDMDDWIAHTLYTGGYHRYHVTIVHFWEVVRSFDNEQRCHLLQFVTGSSRLPLTGFKDLSSNDNIQQFTIQLSDHMMLPVAHTCFNRLVLPAYETYERMFQMLTVAKNNCNGFCGID